MTPLRVAVIGYGKLGCIHARLINESSDFQLVGIVDPVASSREAAQAELGASVFGDVTEVLDDIDCAVVATPTIYHHPVCMTLLEHHKHVFVEKPITATVAEATELVKAARQNDLTLQVGHVVRFDHRFQAAEQLISNPRLIECTRASGYTFRSMDVGVTLDLMIHDLDLVLSLVDSPVRSIQATGSAVIGPHEDIAHARLTFENGAMANLTASRTSFKQVRQLQATGAEGFVSIDFMQGDTITAVGIGSELSQLEIDLTDISSEQREEISARFFEDLLPKKEIVATPCNAIAEEHSDFHRAIRDGKPPRVCGATGLRVLEIATRIVKTIQAGTTDEPQALGGPHFETDGTLADSNTIHRSPVRGV